MNSEIWGCSPHLSAMVDPPLCFLEYQSVPLKQITNGHQEMIRALQKYAKTTNDLSLNTDIHLGWNLAC